MSDEPVLQVTHLHKSFGTNPALRGVELTLRAGELLGLLGPNGAGKTTLVRSISGRVKPDQGTVTCRGRLGVVPQEIALYPKLTARENLSLFGSLQSIPGPQRKERVEWALEWVGLRDRANDRIETFSGGMKRRINIGCGVLHQPAVVLLDEPTVGVDPQSRERIYEMLESLQAEGVAILLTTHHLDEAERRCDRIAVIDQGKTVASGTLSQLIEQTVGVNRHVHLRLDQPLDESPDSRLRLSEDPRTVVAELADVAGELPELLELIARNSRKIDNLEVIAPSLHAVFIHLTGRELRE